MSTTQVPMAESDVMAQVKAKVGAEDAQLIRKATDWCWIIQTSFPDGPDAYTFRSYMVDVEGPDIRIFGY